MEEDKVEIKGTEYDKKMFYAHCFKCKDKDTIKKNNGAFAVLPFKSIEVPKDKELLKECKEYVKESEKIYHNPNVIKKQLYKYCPHCGNTVIISCKDYVDFYSPKTKKKDKEEKEKTSIN